MPDKFEIPFFKDPTLSPEELRRKKEEHDARNKLLQEQWESSLRKEGAVEFFSAMMRNKKLVRQLFNVSDFDKVTILDDIPASESETEAEKAQREKKRADSGLDAVISYKIGKKTVNMLIKAEIFDFLPLDEDLKQPHKKAIAVQELEQRLLAAYDNAAELTLIANKTENSGPVIDIKLPRLNLNDLISMLSGSSEEFNGVPKGAVLQDKDIKDMSGFLDFLKEDIKRQLSRMLFSFFQEYAGYYPDIMGGRSFPYKLNSLGKKIGKDYKEKNKTWANDFINDLNSLLNDLDSQIINKKFGVNAEEEREKKDLRRLIENVRDVLGRY